MNVENLTIEDVQQAISLVYQHTGIRMTEAKKNLLQARLSARLMACHLTHWPDYWSLVKSDAAECTIFIDLVTTHETYFHRTAGVWDYFSKKYLPSFYKQSPSKTLRIWSAACSTGEEAYTIGMYCEDFAKLHADFSYSISASDISLKVLALAKIGRYQGRSLEALEKANSTFVKNYMHPIDDKVMEVTGLISSKVTFFQNNLFSPPRKKSCFDVIFLRNVLIYFDPSDQEKVIQSVCSALVPEGILVIGESESLGRMKTEMAFIQPLIYQRPKIL